MREILFRGKTIDGVAWEEGYYVHIPIGRIGEDEHLIQTLQGDGRMGILYDVIPETIGQYTGLKDKNGKRIFEGDIVINKHPRRLSNKPFVVEYKPIVGGYGYWRLDIHDQLEVIGNIYNNPELLEVEHDR